MIGAHCRGSFPLSVLAAPTCLALSTDNFHLIIQSLGQQSSQDARTLWELSPPEAGM